MKKEALFTFICFSIIGFIQAQSELPKKIWSLANAYRAEKNIAAVKWSQELYFAANHHAQYLQEINKNTQGKILLSHDETLKTTSVVPIEKYTDRIKKYSSQKLLSSNENCLYTYISSTDSNEEIAQQVIHQWKKSDGHNRNLLASFVNHAGVAFSTITLSDGSIILFCVWVAAEF